MDGMNKEKIFEKIKAHLSKQTGDKSGGSGHLSNISITDISIDEIKEMVKDGNKQLKVIYSYTENIQSEFTIAEDYDPEKQLELFNPYHIRKKDEIVLHL